jgi:hypothetical protein
MSLWVFILLCFLTIAVSVACVLGGLAVYLYMLARLYGVKS